MGSRQFLSRTGDRKTRRRGLLLVGLLAVLVLASFGFRRPWLVKSTDAADLSSSSVPVPWEHGWKTNRVIATRYVSSKDYNIGFRFPRNPYHGNSAEVFEFYQKHGGVCWHVGREQLVRFEGVHDTESADRKLEEILPLLTELLENLDHL